MKQDLQDLTGFYRIVPRSESHIILQITKILVLYMLAGGGLTNQDLQDSTGFFRIVPRSESHKILQITKILVLYVLSGGG